MANPDYEAVGKIELDVLKDVFPLASKDELVTRIRQLFDDPSGELVYLKKKDTLALADRLQAEGEDWSRSDYVEMLDSLTE